jgi:hypothetical protein
MTETDIAPQTLQSAPDPGAPLQPAIVQIPVAVPAEDLSGEAANIILGIDYFRATQTSGAPDNIHYNRQADQQAELLQRLATLVEKMVSK